MRFLYSWYYILCKILFMQQPSDSCFHVAFLGNNGHLATAKIGDSKVDIWTPPPKDSQFVLKSASDHKIELDKHSIIWWVVVHKLCKVCIMHELCMCCNYDA